MTDLRDNIIDIAALSSVYHGAKDVCREITLPTLYCSPE